MNDLLLYFKFVELDLVQKYLGCNKQPLVKFYFSHHKALSGYFYLVS